MWIILAIFSALCLGFYDVSKKLSLTSGSVIQVLFLSVVVSSLLLLPLLLLSRIGIIGGESIFFVPSVGARTHGFILIKSGLVLASWLCAYSAMKHLPITLVAPLNATRPMWTLLGAVLLFGEVLNVWQWVGIIVALGCFYAFSVIGKREGVSVSNKDSRLWLFALLAAILLGAASGLYDKYLMRQFDHMAVQVYYTFYQAIMMGIVFAVSAIRSSNWKLNWRWSIGMIGLFLVVSDFVYFIALSDPNSLISVVSTVRRSGCVIPFVYGIVWLKDKHPLGKTLCLIGVLLGILCLLFGSL